MRLLFAMPATRRLTRRLSSSRGQSVVEFALLAPVFLLLFLFALDLGRMYFTYVQVGNAAREAAAYGATQPTDNAGMQVRAAQEKSSQSQGEAALEPLTVTCATPLKVAVACADAAGAIGAGNTLTVTATQRFNLLTPLIQGFLGNNVRLSASATTAIFVSAVGGTGGAPTTCAAPSLATFTVVQSGRDIILDPGGSKPDAGLCTISGYNWDYGDGATDVGSSIPVSHTYAADGNYTITLEVTNQGGSLTAIRTITVPLAAPTPTPTASPSSGPTPSPTASPSPTPSPSPCPKPVANFTWVGTTVNKQVQFTDTSTAPPQCPITTWLWDFGDSTPNSNAPNPLHTYGNSSSKTVQLTVTSTSGSTSVTRSVNP